MSSGSRRSKRRNRWTTSGLVVESANQIDAVEQRIQKVLEVMTVPESGVKVSEGE